jgi:hypothetical protein
MCTYTASITTNCTQSDAYGTTAFDWASSIPANTTISSEGLAAGLAAGTSIITVQAGDFTSNPGVTLTTTAASTPLPLPLPQLLWAITNRMSLASPITAQ